MVFRALEGEASFATSRHHTQERNSTDDIQSSGSYTMAYVLALQNGWSTKDMQFQGTHVTNLSTTSFQLHLLRSQQRHSRFNRIRQ